ncbi:MAG TPA: FtsQ-type POTRA domain-containing protein [Acidimicrobiales bacterium]|nr:FtsQ-type POTRA domain-containing protein [Acidimicrobiales bacterium]
MSTPTPVPARPRVRVDPRIHRRRAAVLRDEGRRRFRALASAAAVVGLALAAAGATRSPLMDVDYVDLQGAEHTARADLLRATGLDRHPQLIDVKTSEVVRRTEALPWVEAARAEKAWPRTVRIRITERTEAAVAAVKGGGWALLDRTGRVLEVGPDRRADIIGVAGIEVAAKPGRTVGAPARDALAVAAAVPRHLHDRVRDVTLAPGGELELRLAPSGIVRFGPAEQVAAKVQALETMLAKVDLRRLAVLDIRAPSAPVLTRR